MCFANIMSLIVFNGCDYTLYHCSKLFEFFCFILQMYLLQSDRIGRLADDPM